MEKKIFIASDHAGWELKELIKKSFPHFIWSDLGPETQVNSVDYPDYADKVCSRLSSEGTEPQAILICGSGQGMAIRANKYPHIRAALVWNEESARLSREHNDANVLCLGGRLLTSITALECVKIFLNTPFAMGRHSDRVKKIHKPLGENKS